MKGKLMLIGVYVVDALLWAYSLVILLRGLQVILLGVELLLLRYALTILFMKIRLHRSLFD